MTRDEQLTDTRARWTRAAARAPAIAVGRLLLRVGLLLLTVPGAMHLSRLVRWSWNTGQEGLLVLIVAHFVAVALAIGLPTHESALSDDRTTFLRTLRGRYASRAARLGVLARVVSLEAALFFIAPPLMTVLAGNPLRWPASFVVAVAACTVVWPLERIAAAQRSEARRLSDRLQ